MHDPDSFQGLIDLLTGARDAINANGGIDGKPVSIQDSGIEAISVSASECLASDPADVNRNCRLDLEDAILALQTTTGTSPPLGWREQTGVSGSGKVGIPELIYILQKLSGLR